MKKHCEVHWVGTIANGPDEWARNINKFLEERASAKLVNVFTVSNSVAAAFEMTTVSPSEHRYPGSQDTKTK